MKRVLVELIDVLEGGFKAGEVDCVSVYKVSLLSNGIAIKSLQAVGELEKLAHIHNFCTEYKIENNDYNVIHKMLV